MGPALLLSLLAATGGDRIVAVFDIENRGVKTSPQTLERLTDYVATLLASSDRMRVVPRGELRRALMAEKAESYRECYDESCQIEIGKEVAATESLSTEISRLGNTCVVSMQLFDLRTAASVDAASARGGCSEDAIVALVERAAGDLSGKKPSAPIPAARPIATPPPPPRASEVTRPGKKLSAVPTRRLLDRRPQKWGRKDKMAAKLLERVVESGKGDDGATRFRLATLYMRDDGKKREAIAQLETLLARWPRYKRADEALFELGRLYHEVGKKKRAKKVWAKLVKLYPSSPNVPSAYFGLGEHFYDAGHVPKALTAYKRATNDRAHPRIGEIARYKLAFCLYRLGKTAEADKAVARLLAADPSPRVREAAEAARDGFRH